MSSSSFWPDAGMTDANLPSTPLYHYTDRVGLEGVVSSFALRASSSQFLNDSSELSYSTELIAEVASQIKSQTSDWFGRQLLDHAIGLNDAPDFKRQLFVFSLSEEGDLLSQWRAYGRPADAYAIGFDPARLRKALTEQRVLLARCIYARDDQAARIRDVIRRAIDNFRAKGFANNQPITPRTQKITSSSSGE